MAKHPEFKAPQGVHVKMPEPEAGLFDDEPIVADIPNVVYKAPEIEWLDFPARHDTEHPAAQIEPYPFTGEPVWLTPDGTTEYVAVWRVTREFKDGRFQPVGFWAFRNSGGQKVPFEPLGYRRYEEPIFVPKKRA